jgi:hypothetical protein
MPVTVNIELYHPFHHTILQTLMTEFHAKVPLEYYLLSPESTFLQLNLMAKFELISACCLAQVVA